ncbi:MAG: T9SS type A sorting domain-containing protein [Saprospiraceae bacterium]|nr:T9SS type A sorting domain-containing protein [Saprospiraceae bacterium]
MNRGLGSVITRRIPMVIDTLDDACLIATKHANGRDWWVVVSEDTKSAYYIFLVDPSGVKLHLHQNFGIPKSRGEAGQSFFSNDGQYFCTATNDGLLNRYHIFFMKFNRCEGKFDSFQFLRLNYQINDWDAGCAFSSNGKYLYYTKLDTLYQFSLNGNNLAIGKISGIYDGFKELTSGGFTTPTQFGPMQFAPDGKIYGQVSFPTRSLHVIHNPNGDFENCNFKQHDIYSPTIRSCLPNFPNYRLGPIDGSVCDSLGIDNIPWCHWRYHQDSLDFLNFQFTDLSAYEVEEWHWNFGDPASAENGSTQQHPVHRFSKPGIYEVCLIVKNKNGADTLCRTVRIAVVNNENTTEDAIQIQNWPNPFSHSFVLNVIGYNPQDMHLELVDLMGQVVHRQKLQQGSHWIHTKHLPPGTYSLQVFERNERVFGKQVLKF